MVCFLSLVCYTTTFIIVFCCLLYYTVFLRQVSKWKESNIPFLQPFFLVKHKYLFNLHKRSLLIALDRIYRENEDKDLVAFFLGPIPLIFVRDHVLIQKIFVKNFDKTFVSFFDAPMDDVTTQSIVAVSSDKTQWKIGRAQMAPMFSPLTMGGAQFSKFKKNTERMWRHLEEALNTGQPISVWDCAHNFIMDSMSLRLFGEETNSYEEEPELHAVVGEFHASSFREMLGFILPIGYPSLQKYGVKVFSSLKLVSQKYVNWMRTFLEDKIEYRLKNKIRLDDFVDYLIDLRVKNTSNNHSEAGAIPPGAETGVSIHQMTGYALTMVLIGTTAVVQVCVIVVHMLSLHPEYQDRIRREIEDAMKKHQVSELTFEVIQDLAFTEQCAYEALRLIPFFMVNMRRCSEDFQIPGMDYKFRRGDVFITTPYSMHRDPKYFKDPEKFDPERFSPENRNSQSALPESLTSFGHGHRKCPGYKIGALQVVMFVASFLLKYEIRPRSHLKQMTAADIDPVRSYNAPKEALLVDITPRYTDTP